MCIMWTLQTPFGFIHCVPINGLASITAATMLRMLIQLTRPTFWVPARVKPLWSHVRDMPISWSMMKSPKLITSLVVTQAYSNISSYAWMTFGCSTWKSKYVWFKNNSKYYAYADCRPKREEILKHCRFLVRKLRYEEMARIDPLKAMQYLREHISDVIDHSDAEQLNNVSAELLYIH